MNKKRRIILICIVLTLLVGLGFAFYLHACRIERESNGLSLVCYPYIHLFSSDCEREYRSCLNQQRAGINIACFPCE